MLYWLPTRIQSLCINPGCAFGLCSSQKECIYCWILPALMWNPICTVTMMPCQWFLRTTGSLVSIFFEIYKAPGCTFPQMKSRRFLYSWKVGYDIKIWCQHMPYWSEHMMCINGLSKQEFHLWGLCGMDTKITPIFLWSLGYHSSALLPSMPDTEWGHPCPTAMGRVQM